MSNRPKIRPVVLQRHQAGTAITARDLNAIQDNVQRALNTLQAIKLVADQLDNNAVQNQNVAGNAINGFHLAPGSISDVHISTLANILGTKLAGETISLREMGPGSVDDSKVAADANINASKLLDGSIQEAKVADGAITDAKVSTGITGSKVSGALANATLEAAAITTVGGKIAGTQIASITAAQLSTQLDLATQVTGALPDANIAGVSASKLTGTINNARLVGVPSTSLAGDLRSSCKVRVLSGNEPTVDTTAIPFGDEAHDGSIVVDTLGEMSAATFNTYTPLGSAAQVVRLHIQLHLRAAGLTLGCRAQILVKNTRSTAVVVAASHWHAAEIAPDGTVEILAVLDTQVKLTGGDPHQVFVDVVDRFGSALGGVTVKGESLSASPYLAGSFFEATAVPNS